MKHITAAVLALLCLPAAACAKTHTFRLHNDVDMPAFEHVYIGTPGSDSWGKPRNTRPLEPGSFLTFMVKQCHISFKLDEFGSYADLNVCVEPDFTIDASVFGD